jgi:hypothetical protein
MSDSLTKLLDRVSDDSAKGLLQFIESLGLSLDDARIEDFLKQTNLIDEIHQQNIQSVENVIRSILAEQSKKDTVEIINAALQKAATVQIDHTKIVEAVQQGIEQHTDYSRITDIIETAVQSAFEEMPKSGNLPDVTIMSGICGVAFLTGIIVCAAFANFFWLPKSIDATYLKNTAELKYLSSAEGKLFRDIVRLNSGYLDTGKCKADAVAQKLSLSRVGSKEKVVDVCVLVVP